MTEKLNLIGRIRKALSQEQLGLAFVLDFIESRAEKGIHTRATDIVQLIEFGTGPTVHKKILALKSKGFIEVKNVPGDMRATMYVPTKAGRSWLKDIEKKIA